MLLLRLHEALLNQGIDSRVHFRLGNLAARNSERLEYAHGFPRRIRERLLRRFATAITARKGNLFAPLKMPWSSLLPDRIRGADAFHLHWVSHWLDLPSFVESLPADVPIVFTIHDLGNFTGGCHIYCGCNAFEAECRRCPVLKAPFNRFLAHREWKRKQRSLRSRRVHVVGNSSWTTRLAASASSFGRVLSFRTIHPGIETAEFARHHKAAAKQLLGIPPDRFVVGFGCAELTDVNKNVGAFLELLGLLAQKLKLEAVVFGNGLSFSEEPPVRIHQLGKLASSRLLSLAYSAMDTFVMTSSVETFGQVALEAEACGTPVCAFEVGGLSDAVRSGTTGFLTPAGDLNALASSILSLACSEELRRNLGGQAFAWSRANFTMEKTVKAYLEVYREAIAVR